MCREKLLGGDHPDTLASYAAVGEALQKHGMHLHTLHYFEISLLRRLGAGPDCKGASDDRAWFRKRGIIRMRIMFLFLLRCFEVSLLRRLGADTDRKGVSEGGGHFNRSIGWDGILCFCCTAISSRLFRHLGRTAKVPHIIVRTASI